MPIPHAEKLLDPAGVVNGRMWRRRGERRKGAALTSVPPINITRQAVRANDNDVLVHASADELCCRVHGNHKAAACSCDVKCNSLLGAQQCLDL